MDDKHLELLTRIDERQAMMQGKLDDIIPIVKRNQDDIKAAKTHIGIMKWLGGAVTALASYFGFAN